MVKIANTLFYLLGVLFFGCSKEITLKEQLNINDSIQVEKYIREKSDCELINYIETNKILFHNYEGYSNLIWNHLASERPTKIFTTIATGHHLINDTLKSKEIDSIVLNLRKNYECK